MMKVLPVPELVRKSSNRPRRPMLHTADALVSLHLWRSISASEDDVLLG